MSVVLVVDDDQAIRQLVRMTLFDEGFDVLDAQDGLEALAVLDASQVDAIVLDLQMPRMDGRAFIAALRARGLPSVPILILAAQGSETVRRETGVQGAMSKPFDPDGLIEAVRAVTA